LGKPLYKRRKFMDQSRAGSAEVFTWLSRFINLERGQSLKSFRLDRMEILAALAGHPERSAPVIHVAGSKGKGSVTGMIAAILEAEGLRTARYTSPHVLEYRERITQGSAFFDESVYTGAGEELRAVEEELRTSSKPEFKIFNQNHDGGEAPTFFELLTLYFFLCARRAGSELMIVETGMGGRLDATNIVSPLASVITLIELEHTEYLGNTLAAIAGEKAGIIKAGKPLILAGQEEEALKVFRRKVLDLPSPLFYFPDEGNIKNIRVTKEGTSFALEFFHAPLFPALPDLSVPIPGEIQAENAGLAVLAAKTAFLSLGEEAVRRGLRDFKLPARFERIQDTPPLIIDGAHTKESIKKCVETFTGLYGEGGILLFGCAAGKDAQSMGELLIPHFSRIIITTPGTFKKSYPQEVYGRFAETAAGRKGLTLVHIGETEKAVDQALLWGRETGLPILGTGSFYLASEIRNSSSLRGETR
jgi:dihydrofolate synthase/folylpolyglutamate synthase